MSFLNKIFGQNKQAPRTLSSVKELLVGDMIVLTDSFALPENLRAQQFQVSAVNSYEFEQSTQSEWVLTGNDDLQIYLSLEVDDKSYLKFSMKLDDNDVETLFNLDDFATIFDEPGQALLTRQQDSELTSGWSSEQYQQRVFCQVGYFHRKDHRHESLSAYQGKDSGEQFECYVLYDQSQSKGIDLEVWQDGDTDVFLTLYRPLTDIVDLFPGS